VTATPPADEPLVVVGVDGSQTARRAVRAACEEASLRHATLRIIHVVHVPAALRISSAALFSDLDRDFARRGEEILVDAVGVAQRSGVTVATRLDHGDPARCLLDSARQASLLVVGASGEDAYPWSILGSVAARITHHAACPVMVVPRSD
jgi:nucleotide-binding universal stress UspA family protein